MQRSICVQEITWSFKEEKNGQKNAKGVSIEIQIRSDHTILNRIPALRNDAFSFRSVDVLAFSRTSRKKRKHRNGFLFSFDFPFVQSRIRIANPSANKCKFNFYNLVSIKKVAKENSKLHDVCILVFSKQMKFFSLDFSEWKSKSKRKTRKMHRMRGRKERRNREKTK